MSNNFKQLSGKQQVKEKGQNLWRKNVSSVLSSSLNMTLGTPLSLPKTRFHRLSCFSFLFCGVGNQIQHLMNAWPWALAPRPIFYHHVWVGRRSLSCFEIFRSKGDRWRQLIVLCLSTQSARRGVKGTEWPLLRVSLCYSCSICLHWCSRCLNVYVNCCQQKLLS